MTPVLEPEVIEEVLREVEDHPWDLGGASSWRGNGDGRGNGEGANQPTVARRESKSPPSGCSSDWGECEGSELLQLPGLLISLAQIDGGVVAQAGQVVDRGKGLCVNCSQASTCTFPRPAGGVWHCEEYA